MRNADQPTSETVLGARSMVVVRRTEPAGEPEPIVHLVSLPLASDGAAEDVVSALCGVRLRADQIETVTPAAGTWCTLCVVNHVTGQRPAPFPDTPSSTGTVAGCRSAGVAYRELGWPVIQCRNQVALDLSVDLDAVALVFPALLGTEVADILVRRHCSPPVLAHPYLPAHRIILAGDRCPVSLPWPAGVHRITDTLLLPPTVTARGPIFWVHPPRPQSLRRCREIDVFGVLYAE